MILVCGAGRRGDARVSLTEAREVERRQEDEPHEDGPISTACTGATPDLYVIGGFNA